MTLHVETLTLSDGSTVQIVSTRTPEQRKRFEHLCKLFGCWDTPQDAADERTAQDDDEWRRLCALRNQQADDDALYNEQGGDYRDVGY